MAKIKDEDIDLLRERADIVEIISAYTTLKKSGGHTYKGLCPIHDEKTPSFTVDAARGLAHCFGCGWGGNVYQFVQEKESLPFPEAVELVARKAGYNLRYEDETDRQRKNKGLRQRIIEANQIAAEFWHENLIEDPEATEARRYLGTRGFNREVAKRWLLGYAPGRDATCKLLLSKDFTKEEIVSGGLGRISDRDGALFDSFRQRITFPTWDLTNQIVAFGARAVGDQQPKYLNTQETPAFSKSRFMYGLNRAKSAIARDKPAIVVEGYTDVIALHEAGMTEAVATNGTALGESHLTLLRKFTGRVVLVFDSDAAGFGAAARGYGDDPNNPLFKQVGVDILVASVASGLDPADLIREGRVDELKKAIEDAAPIWDAKLEQTIAALPLDTPEARSRAVRASVEVLRSHPDPVARHEYAFLVSKRVGVDVEVVQRALGEGSRRVTEPYQGAGTERRIPGHVKVEREALRLLLTQGKQVLPLARGLDESVFTSPSRRELFTRALVAAADGAASSQVANSLSEEARSLFAELTVGEPDESRDEVEIREVFMRLKVFRLEREIKSRRATLQEVNPMDDAEKHDSLFTELVGLEAERRDLLRSIQGAA